MELDGHSGLSAFGLLFCVIVSLSILIVPRAKILVPIAVTACFMTFAQEIVIAGLNITVLRIVVMVAVARVILGSLYRHVKWLPMDGVLLLWAISGTVAYTLLWGSTDALINRLGSAYNALGLYFVFRCTVRTLDDVAVAAKVFSMTLVPLAILMAVESLTKNNLFSSLGGVPSEVVIREGIARCQGPFLHPIMAGTFGASWLSLFVGLWWYRPREKIFPLVGASAAVAITLLSGSSGPLGTLMFGIAGIMLIEFRQYVRGLFWLSIGLLITLHFVMKAPVWFVLARINILSGSTGWHRANVIDLTISNFADWWLIGVRDVSAWGIWAGDITNQYVLEGVRGGLITMMLFIAVISLGFRSVGFALRRFARLNRRSLRLSWAVGSTLFTHTLTFFTISYFDQNIVNWYLALAFVAAVYNSSRSADQPDIVTTNMRTTWPHRRPAYSATQSQYSC